MNNRDFRQQRRKRSFEFIMGLINNNSKFEVIRSDSVMKPERMYNQTSSKNQDNSNATRLLLDLLSKIVAFPDHWRQIHQVLRSLDQDLISSENILRSKQEKEKQNFHMELKRKLKEKEDVQRLNSILTTTTNKWPNFDDVEENTVPTYTEAFKKDEKFSERFQYQKNFAYHKVTGKPAAHLKKTPTAYIAVSAISAKSSEPKEDFLLETELHQLKPWKNKLSSQKV
ncbi:uncharacterized protein LOC126735066 isoform X2 [Anthonomus grandis grandis]|uniref:uncharacterized protein LOC126735066 isoform X2 n=1 Tax=Anthonomus grandis grandis TaxID=2921223 RepID=UPI00216643C6|nr:uncharacterized protein LOC126735066 isoform X2 [Anthonomus grandis grandis]